MPQLICYSKKKNPQKWTPGLTDEDNSTCILMFKVQSGCLRIWDNAGISLVLLQQWLKVVWEMGFNDHVFKLSSIGSACSNHRYLECGSQG